MRAVLIDPWLKTIEEVELDSDKNIGARIGCEWITGVQVNARLFMYLDEVGCLPPSEGGPKVQRFFTFEHHSYKPNLRFGGCGLVLGSTAGGNSRSVKPGDLKLMQSIVRWLEVHPVDVAHSESWVDHPVFGRVKQFKKAIVWAKGNKEKA